MLVGNDVVDLRDPFSQPNVIHPHFDVRVFTPAERENLLESDLMTHRHRWALWAAKESSYKVARKIDPTVRFLPRQFVVDRLEERWAAVQGGGGLFFVHLRQRDDWVHAVATSYVSPSRKLSTLPGPGPSGIFTWGNQVLRSAEVRLLDNALDDPSEIVRELARESIASGMAVASEEIKVASSERIPRVRMRDTQLHVDLSLSHHGRYVAYAWAGPAPG